MSNNVQFDKNEGPEETASYQPAAPQSQPVQQSYYGTPEGANHSFNGGAYINNEANPTMGIVAFITGVAGFFTGIAAVAAIIFGIISLKKGEEPRWWGITGLILGGVVILSGILLTILFVLFVMGVGLAGASSGY